MLREQRPLTNPETDSQIMAVLEPYQSEEYTSDDFEKIVTNIREASSESILAAAITDIRDNSAGSGHPNYLIQSARNAVDRVFQVERFIAEHEDAPLFTANPYTVSMFSTKDMVINRGRDQFNNHIMIEGTYQEEAQLHGHNLGRIDTSWHDEERGSWGGSRPNGFYLRDAVEGVWTAVNVPASPVLIGTEEIAQKFRNYLYTESRDGFIENRTKTISYIIWLTRNFVPGLAEPIEEIAREFDVDSVWRDQCAQQFGARAAEVMEMMQEKPGSEKGIEFARRIGSELIYREIKLDNVSLFAIEEVTIGFCRQRGISFEPDQLERAIKIVTADYFEQELAE